MADAELVALTEDTAPALTDLVYKVDSAGTIDRKVQLVNLRRFVGCRLTRVALQTFTTAVGATISWDSEREDTNGFHDNVTNPTRITIPAGLAGVYHLTASVDWVSNATGYRQIFFFKNATSAVLGIDSRSAVTGVATQVTISGLVRLAVGDYIEVFAFQNSGGNLDISKNSEYTPEFAMALVGP